MALDKTPRDRPDATAISPEMISAGVFALQSHCPSDLAFPVGGEEIAVEAVLRAALSAQVHSLPDSVRRPAR